MLQHYLQFAALCLGPVLQKHGESHSVEVFDRLFLRNLMYRAANGSKTPANMRTNSRDIICTPVCGTWC